MSQVPRSTNDLKKLTKTAKYLDFSNSVRMEKENPITTNDSFKVSYD